MSISKAIGRFFGGKKKVSWHGMAQRQQQLDQRMLEMSRSMSSEQDRLKQVTAEALKHAKDIDFEHAFGISLRTTYDTIVYFEDYLKRLDKLYSAARKEGLSYTGKEMASFFIPARGVLHLYSVTLACSLRMRNDRIFTHDHAKLSKYISALSKKLDSFFYPLPVTFNGICKRNDVPVSSGMAASLEDLSRISADLLKLTRKKDLSLRDLKGSNAAKDFPSLNKILP